MPQTNSTLSKAKKEKNAEFYTQLTDIEKELVHYEKHFKNKVIFCNCDDPFESNFFKYFVLNFNKLGLKKLITTSYVSSPVKGKEYEPGFAKPYKAIVTTVHDATGNGAISMEDIKKLFERGENELTELEGDGDFRSNEAIECLKEADIVVTNPPFPLFREYVAQLMEYNKKFIIIGNQNAIAYKEFFPLLKENKVWIGYNKVTKFMTPSGMRQFGNVGWYTNLDIEKRHEDLILIEKYNSKKYLKYDNYDAIEVSKVVNIPYDYDGVMGVPISFMDKYNSERFEIVECHEPCISVDKQKKWNPNFKEYRSRQLMYNGVLCQKTYHRLFIRNKHPEK